MFLVGLTGGIATGKSVVASIFKDENIPIIDADAIARQIVLPGKPAYKKIQLSFGSHVFKVTGEIDRVKLGLEIFSDIEKRRLLNSITHPYIYGEMRKQVIKYFLKGEQFVVMDLPLLYETRSVLPYLHKTIVVTCEPDIQLERLVCRNNLTHQEGKKRIQAQMPMEEKTSMADIVIENSGSLGNTRRQVNDILKVLKSSKRHIWNRLILISTLVLIFAIVVMLISAVVKRYDP